MKVRVEVQMTAKGMADDHDHGFRSAFRLDPVLNDVRAQHVQIIQQMPILPEGWPEHVRHGEYHSDIRHLRQCRGLLDLPDKRVSASAARAASRLAGVIDDFLLGGGRLSVPSHHRCAAEQYIPKALSHLWPEVGAVPGWLRPSQYSPERLLNPHDAPPTRN